MDAKTSCIAALCAALPLAAQEKQPTNRKRSRRLRCWKNREWRPKQPRTQPRFRSKKAVIERRQTVEEIIARVNNEIITKSEYEKARNSARKMPAGLPGASALRAVESGDRSKAEDFAARPD